MVQPRHQEQKEGSRVEFECNISGETEVRYQWFKDDSKIQGQRNSSLVLDPVKVEDFGNYKCEVKYDDGDSEKCVTSLPAELDVIPSDGMSECQLFANYHLFWVLHVLLILFVYIKMPNISHLTLPSLPNKKQETITTH